MLKLKLQYFGHLMRRVIHWKRLWCWEGLGAEGEGDDRGWDGWMASLTRWMWVWVNSGSWWWTGRPGVLWFMGSQRVGHDWATELNWISQIGYGQCMEIHLKITLEKETKGFKILQRYFDFVSKVFKWMKYFSNFIFIKGLICF